MIKHIFLLFLPLLSTYLSASAQGVSSQLNTAFLTLSNDPSLRNGLAALHVMDSRSGKTVFEKNSHIGLPTASTLKCITSITALDILGADYTYRTILYYTGHVDSLGILHGDVVIQGSGDPTLGSDRYEGCDEKTLLEKWLAAIRDLGITEIQGKIIGDDRLYGGNDVPKGWIWTDIGNYYGAGISSLNWRENKVGINFQIGSPGSAAPIVNTSAAMPYLQLINTVTVGARGTGDNVYAYSAPYANKIYVKGTYGQDLKKTIEISIPDPAFDLAYHFTEYLTNKGISVTEPPTTGQRITEQGETFPQKAKEIYSHTSPKLGDIVHWFNKRSINLYGEALLKSIAQVSGRKSGTSDGAAYLKKYWVQKLKIPEQELDIIDGSGLSPQNNVTAEAMTKIMQYALSRPWYAEFLRSLPTINQMTMKSGTISGTLGYSGYHTAKNDTKYTFTIFVYNYSGSASAMREKMFLLLNSLK